jgi:hypothetical protein
VIAGVKRCRIVKDVLRLTSPPYTFFLLNDDMKLNRNRQFLI